MIKLFVDRRHGENMRKKGAATEILVINLAHCQKNVGHSLTGHHFPKKSAKLVLELKATYISP